MNYHRHLKNRLLSSISASPILFLTGGRQTGKTTLMREIAQEKGCSFLTFDDLRYLAAAREDPMGVLEGHKLPLIIDEVQRVPEIGLPLKLKVDQNRKPGMYLLTGSSNPLAAPKLNDSLAGRMFLFHLWPLAQCEIKGTSISLIDDLFSLNWTPGKGVRWAKEAKIDCLVKGGYPTAQTLSLPFRNDWFNSHARTLLERDVQELAHLRKTEDLSFLMQILAHRSGSLLNVAELSRTAKIPHSTLSFYLTLLEAMYLIFRQPAWHKNATKRMTKAPKVYVTDTGMAAYFTGADEKRLFSDPMLVGSLLETFVVLEIKKLLSWGHLHLHTFHYRTADGTEVDLLLENRAGEIVGVEIKNSETIRSEDFKALRALQEELKGRFVRGIVLYPGEEAVPFGEKLHAVPLSSLWNPSS